MKIIPNFCLIRFHLIKNSLIPHSWLININFDSYFIDFTNFNGCMLKVISFGSFY